MAKITKTWSKAGTLPGQYQKLTITYKSRDGDKVKVHYKLYVKSKGTDNYPYSSRHNKFSIYHPNGKKVAGGTYQAKGTHATRTRQGNITISGVGDSTTSLNFWYRNQRVWPGRTNSWDPRSTGVVGKTKIGSLKIPSNVEYDITFDPVLTNNITEKSCYKGNKFTIPNLGLSSHFYEFKGWTDVDYISAWEESRSDSSDPDEGQADQEPIPGEEQTTPESDDHIEGEPVVDDSSTIESYDEEIPTSLIVNTLPLSKYNPGSTITVSKNIDLFAVWYPKTCRYRFYNYKNEEVDFGLYQYTFCILEDPETKESYRGKTNLPNASLIENKGVIPNGYVFCGWQCRTDGPGNYRDYLVNENGDSFCSEWYSRYSEKQEVWFYPIFKPAKNKVTFFLPSSYREDGSLTANYETDSVFNMRWPLVKLQKDEISFNPGFKLVGWMTMPPENPSSSLPRKGAAFPNEAFNINGINTVHSFRNYLPRFDNSLQDYYVGNGYKIYPTSGNVIFDYSDFKDKFKKLFIYDGEEYTGTSELQLYPYYEYYTTIYMYVDNTWKLAMPYIYYNGKWNMALSYVYTENGWKL